MKVSQQWKECWGAGLAAVAALLSVAGSGLFPAELADSLLARIAHVGIRIAPGRRPKCLFMKASLHQRGGASARVTALAVLALLLAGVAIGLGLAAIFLGSGLHLGTKISFGGAAKFPSMRKPQQWKGWLGAVAAVLFAAGVLLFLGVAMQLWLLAWAQAVLNTLLILFLCLGLHVIYDSRCTSGVAAGIAGALGALLSAACVCLLLGQLLAAGYGAFR